MGHGGGVIDDEPEVGDIDPVDALVRIAGRSIGLGEMPYVIAELGVNHDGSLDRALELTRAAAEEQGMSAREFHSEALALGSVPMSVLREAVLNN